MYDDIKSDIGFNKYYSYLNKIFDLPFAEVIKNNLAGVLFFSKIIAESIEFNYSENTIKYRLLPLEIRFADLYRNTEVTVWRRKKNKEITVYQYKEALVDWLNNNKIEPVNIIDYGPLHEIMNERILFMNYANTVMYLETSEIAKRRFMKPKDQNEEIKKLKMIRRMLPKKKSRSSIIKEVKRNKFYFQNFQN